MSAAAPVFDAQSHLDAARLAFHQVERLIQANQQVIVACSNGGPRSFWTAAEHRDQVHEELQATFLAQIAILEPQLARTSVDLAEEREAIEARVAVDQVLWDAHARPFEKHGVPEGAPDARGYTIENGVMPPTDYVTSVRQASLDMEPMLLELRSRLVGAIEKLRKAVHEKAADVASPTSEFWLFRRGKVKLKWNYANLDIWITNHLSTQSLTNAQLAQKLSSEHHVELPQARAAVYRRVPELKGRMSKSKNLNKLKS